MDNKRYMIVILGSSKGIDDDLNNIADAETGVHYVDGTGIFIGTFFSPYTSPEIHNFLVDRPAFMLFDITSDENYSVNLPSKYYEGIFPEIGEVIPKVEQDDTIVSVDSLTDVDEIIDKLEKNNFDRESLTKKEQDILDNC